MDSDSVSNEIGRRNRSPGSIGCVIAACLGIGFLIVLLAPLFQRSRPPVATRQALNDLLAQHPFWFVVAMVGWAGLCAAVMFIAVYIQLPRLRPQMSDRRQPVFFRYSWAVFRFAVITAMWGGMGLAVGLGLAMVLGLLKVYPAQPYGFLLFVASSCLSAGLAGLKAMQPVVARPTHR